MEGNKPNAPNNFNIANLCSSVYYAVKKKGMKEKTSDSEMPIHPHQHKQTAAVINRLSRIEGHVVEIKRMGDSRNIPNSVLY
jgi:hypothetical protein